MAARPETAAFQVCLTLPPSMSAFLTLAAALRWPQIARPAELNPNTPQRSIARTVRSAGK